MTRPIIILQTSNGQWQVQLHGLVLGVYDSLVKAKQSILEHKGVYVEVWSSSDIIEEYVI